jgi:hypothetical protein
LVTLFERWLVTHVAAPSHARPAGVLPTLKAAATDPSVHCRVPMEEEEHERSR